MHVMIKLTVDPGEPGEPGEPLGPVGPYGVKDSKQLLYFIML